MGEDEDDNHRQDEKLKLKRLQRIIEDRKRKLHADENVVKHVDHDTERFGEDFREEDGLSKKKEKKRNKKEQKKEMEYESHFSSDDRGTDNSEDSGIEREKKAEKEEFLLSDTVNSELNPEGLEAEDMEEDKDEETGFTVIGGQTKKEVEKVQRVLPDWLAKPVAIDSDLRSSRLPVEQIPYLNQYIIKKLQQHSIIHLFPVQTSVIPVILSQIESGSCFGRGGFQPSDICVCAPTGSGKTLAYVLPIIQTLLNRVVRHLRALIVLPTKDLANQVKEVFEMFSEGTNLKVGLASGSKSISKEQKELVGINSYGSNSRVDVLVCTPGRLANHIASTPHFTLQHIRFLVIDEADCLLDKSYFGWLWKVLKAAYNKEPKTEAKNGCCNHETVRNPPGQQTPASFATIQLPLQKLLFSATMTHSPERLAPLQLYQPILFTVNRQDEDELPPAATGKLIARHTVPESLSQYMAICSDGEKPLMVLYLVTQLKFQRVLCFTSTLEATHRLFLLVKLYGGVQVAEFSSNLSPQQRKGILRDFKEGRLQLLICTDAMARGMDIHNVSYVISYDVPKFAKNYIHRVGRTARAGNQGTAITLLHSNQVYDFNLLIQKTGHEKIPEFEVKVDEVKSMVEKYQKTLSQLQDAVKFEGKKKAKQQRRQQSMEQLTSETVH